MHEPEPSGAGRRIDRAYRSADKHHNPPQRRELIPAHDRLRLVPAGGVRSVREAPATHRVCSSSKGLREKSSLRDWNREDIGAAGELMIGLFVSVLPGRPLSRGDAFRGGSEEIPATRSSAVHRSAMKPTALCDVE